MRRAFAPVAVVALVLSACVSAPPRAWPRNPPPARTDASGSDADPVPLTRAERRRRVVVHTPFRESRCDACHVSARGGGMLLASADRLCRSCHGERIARAAVHPPAARSCLECHSRHVSMSEGRLAGNEPQLCLRCHGADIRALDRAHQGYPVAGARCSRCHDPHGRSGERALRAELHRPASRCTNCHVAATEAEPLALLRSERETCGRCHPGDDPNAEAGFEHAPFGARCSECHEAHGSDRKHLLRDEEKVLCVSCHAELGEKLAGMKEIDGAPHAPAADGRCHACHSPHRADQPALLVQSAPELCLGCHKAWHETPAAEGAPRDEAEARCLYCHDPHGSGRRGLMKRERRLADAAPPP